MFGSYEKISDDKKQLVPSGEDSIVWEEEDRTRKMV
jgi:hypothetical protein